MSLSFLSRYVMAVRSVKTGRVEERKKSIAGLMKHTCRDITEEVMALPDLNQLSILILPNGILFTYPNMELVDIPTGTWCHSMFLRCNIILFTSAMFESHWEIKLCKTVTLHELCAGLFVSKVKQQMLPIVILPNFIFKLQFALLD